LAADPRRLAEAARALGKVKGPARAAKAPRKGKALARAARVLGKGKALGKIKAPARAKMAPGAGAAPELGSEEVQSLVPAAAREWALARAQARAPDRVRVLFQASPSRVAV
jgi:hypothetical protein